MSMQKVSVLNPPPQAVPRGAVLTGAIVPALLGAGTQLQSAFAAWLEAARARHAVDRAARRDARERAEVLALARRYESTQPEFAKELYAAADRAPHR